MKVEIEGPAKQVTTSPAVVPVPTSGAKEVDIPTTVIRLKVDKVTVKAHAAEGWRGPLGPALRSNAAA